MSPDMPGQQPDNFEAKPDNFAPARTCPVPDNLAGVYLRYTPFVRYGVPDKLSQKGNTLMPIQTCHPGSTEPVQAKSHLPLLLAPYPEEDFRVLIRRRDGFYEAVQSSSNETAVYVETFRNGEKLSGTICLTIEQVGQIHAALGGVLRDLDNMRKLWKLT